MNREQIIRMAREVSTRNDDRNIFFDMMIQELERFAALVADAEAKRIHDEGMVTVGHMREQIAAEREACAKVCEDDFGNGALNLAAAIRARGETK